MRVVIQTWGSTGDVLPYVGLGAAIAFDQFDNGSRVVDPGPGELLPMRRYTAARAAGALDPTAARPAPRRDPGVLR